MATNSIARLAVQITTDTRPMAAGFVKAQATIKEFSKDVSRLSGAGIKTLATDMLGLSGVIGRAGEGFARLAGNMGPYGAAAAAVVAGTAAMVAALVKLAETSDRLADSRLVVDREFFKALDELRGTHFAQLNDGLKTNAELWDQLKGRVASFGELASQTAGLSLKPLYKGLADLADTANRAVFGDAAVDQLNAFHATTKQRAEQAKAMQEQIAARNKALEQEIAEIQREMDAAVTALMNRGKSIAESVRTPDEVFRDTIRELKQLANAGAITGETLGRAVGKAAEEYKRAAGEARKLRAEATAVPALEMGTQAARSAILRSASESREADRAAKESAALLRSIDATLKKELPTRPITLTRGSL